MTVTENTDRNIYFRTERKTQVRVGLTGNEHIIACDISSYGKSTLSNLSLSDAHALADWIKANVPEPKPAWHDAKDGEVWLISPNGKPDSKWPAVFKGGAFLYDVPGEPWRSVVYPGDIASARRIWPAPEGETNA